MRPLLLLACCAALAACVGESEPTAYALHPTTSDPDSLLARLDIGELDAAFERMSTAGYTVAVQTKGLVRDGDADAFEQTIEVSRSGARVVSQSGPPPSADATAAEPPSTAFDPVARLLPKEPPFQNPATREMYGVSRGEVTGSIASASAERREGSDPLTRVEVSVDTTTGQVVRAQAARQSRSAVYTETSTATVEMTRLDGTWWPAHGTLLTEIDVPLSASRRFEIAWRVLSIGGVPLAMDSSTAG